jgi:hypothetical protein
MTPQLFEQIAEMQREQEAKDLATRASSSATQKRTGEANARAFDRVQSERARKEADGEYDWTGSYQHWDKWEDPEEARKCKEEEEAKRNRPAPTGCNHDHSAVSCVLVRGKHAGGLPCWLRRLVRGVARVRHRAQGRVRGGGGGGSIAHRRGWLALFRRCGSSQCPLPTLSPLSWTRHTPPDHLDRPLSPFTHIYRNASLWI